MDVLSTALSGLNAASTRIANSANNIVNARTPDFKPADAVQRAADNGGVIVDIRQRTPDANGEVTPVSLEKEVANTVVAKNDFLANAKLIQIQKQLDKSLLDIQA